MIKPVAIREIIQIEVGWQMRQRLPDPAYRLTFGEQHDLAHWVEAAARVVTGCDGSNHAVIAFLVRPGAVYPLFAARPENFQCVVNDAGSMGSGSTAMRLMQSRICYVEKGINCFSTSRRVGAPLKSSAVPC